MSDNNSIKDVVKEKYGKIATGAKQEGCGCGCGDSEAVDYSTISDSYEDLDGYIAEADLGLGCGLPTEFADIQPGNVVVDLGSGAGSDVFVARTLTGETGRVIGIDMTPEMNRLAEQNAQKRGFTNVEFVLGDIEAIPLPEHTADVVISNCVLNLVPDKERAFSEIYRILKPGAHFCISDVVVQGELPPSLQQSAEMYVGCVAGALQQEDYLQVIRSVGFTDVTVRKSKPINLPEDLVAKYLSESQVTEYRNSGVGIFSITVTGVKPA